MPIIKPKQRNLGLSRDQPPRRSLLQTLPSKPEQPSRPQTPPDITAPPVESDDESETYSESGNSPKARQSAGRSKASSHNMTKIKFEAPETIPGHQRGSRAEDKPRSLRGNGRQTASPITPKEEPEDTPDVEDDLDSDARRSPTRSSKKRPRSGRTQWDSGTMESITNFYQNKDRNNKRGFGKKGQNKGQGPMRTRTVPRKPRQMIVPDALSPVQERTPSTLRIPTKSPTPERELKGIVRPSMSPTPESEQRGLKMPSMSPLRERKGALNTDSLFDSPPAKRHLSKRIVTMSEFGSPQLSPIHSGSDEELSKRASTTIEETCPMCYLPVDRELLRSFSKGKILTMRQQMKFCNLHKEQSAKDTWKKRGYPSIDWSGMNRRLKRHHRLMGQIINGQESHYRTDLAEKLAKGQERTLRKTERSLAPGYYGNRGLRLMSEHIIQHFSERLREKAVDDPVISGRGTTVFVSKVLVPELATRLIMEDMSVELGEARDILLQSVDMGELLQDDVADGEIDAAESMGDRFDFDGKDF